MIYQSEKSEDYRKITRSHFWYVIKVFFVPPAHPPFPLPSREEAAQFIRNDDDIPIKLRLTKDAPLICDDPFDRKVPLGSVTHKSSQASRILSAPHLSWSPINDKSSSRLQFPASQANPWRRAAAVNPRIGRRFPCHYFASHYFCLRLGRKRDTRSQRLFVKRVYLIAYIYIYIYYVGELRYLF